MNETVVEESNVKTGVEGVRKEKEVNLHDEIRRERSENEGKIYEGFHPRLVAGGSVNQQVRLNSAEDQWRTS